MRRFLCLLFCCLVFLSLKMNLFAMIEGNEREQKQDRPHTYARNRTDSEHLKRIKEAERKEAKTVGMLLLGLVIFLGMCIILFAVYWGKRMRRITRKERTTKTEQLDEFWYLQAEKKTNHNTDPDTEIKQPEKD